MLLSGDVAKFAYWFAGGLEEPRHAFDRIVVARYVNQHHAAVRRLAHEAADAGLLSPDLAAGIARVKGV